MQTKALGLSQVQLPEIGLGTWRYAGGAELLRAGIERGACLIDTAEAYGTEEVVGSAMRGLRDRVLLATKVSPRNFRRRDLLAAADRSLRRLDTDYIDLYQLHWPNYTVAIAETMSAMEELVDAGKVRFIGVSNFSVQELKKAQAALSRHRIVSNQVRYCLSERTVEQGLLQFCQQNGITLIAFSPLDMGLPQIRACDPQNVLAQVAATSRKTEAQVALNWLIGKQNVVVIPKASSMAHVMENCDASDWRLTHVDRERLTQKIKFRRRRPIEAAARRLARHCLQLLGRQV